MQAQAYEGYFDNGRFYTAGRTIPIPDHRRVYITILDETTQDDVNQRLKELDELNAMIDASADEEVPIFERTRLHREVEL